MSESRKQSIQDLAVFALLVAIGVAGRWGQPQWCFTPIAAAAIFAGAYFAPVAIAALVPLATLAISDLLLPAYDNFSVLVATYCVMTAPVWLGRMLRSGASGLRLLMCGLVPATLFFIVSNFAVWASTGAYEKSLGGLAQCYWAAVPFYRWMLAGDVFYLAILGACWMLAGVERRVRCAVVAE